MDLDVDIKTPFESIKDDLKPFIEYDIDSVCSQLLSKGGSEFDVFHELQAHVVKTEIEFFKSLLVRIVEDFSEDYFIEMLNKQYWRLYEFGLFMSGWNTSGLSKDCIDFIVNDDLCPDMAKDMIAKVCLGVNEGHVHVMNDKGEEVYNVNSKNLQSLARFKVKVSDVYDWFEKADIGLVPQILIKYRRGEYKVNINKGSLDDDISTREKTGCQNTIAVLIKLILDKWQPEKKGNKSQVISEIVDRYGSLEGIKADTLTKRLRTTLKVLNEKENVQIGSKRLYYCIIAILYSTVLKKRLSGNMNSLVEIESTVIDKLPKLSLRVQANVKSILNDSVLKFDETIQYEQRSVEISEVIKGAKIKI